MTSLGFEPFDLIRLAPFPKTQILKSMLLRNALYLSLCICASVYVLSAQHPIKLDPRCFEATASIQSNCRSTNEEQLSNNAPVREKMIPKIVSFGYKNYEVVNKKRSAVCKTCGSKISDGDATTSNFVRHLKLHKER